MVARSRPSRHAAPTRARAALPPPAAPRPPDAFARRGGWMVAALATLHVALYQSICTIKYQYYLYRDFDLAIFVQALSVLRHGSWFSSIRGMPWLGDHSSLILLPLAPLFALAPHPLTLLAVQTVALAAGAWPLYLLARRLLPAGPLPVACAALYLLHPALGYLNLFEWHPETLAVPLLLWCALELHTGRTRRALLAAGLALSAREDVALVVLGLAAVVALLDRPRRPRLGAGLAGLAVASLVLSFAILKPLLLSGEATYGRMYGAWGDTPGALLHSLVTRPLDALAALWSTPGDAADSLLKRQYWVHLFAPVLALPALAPLWLIPALPVFFEHLLSNRSHQHTIVFQYTALVLPVIAVAAVRGLAGLARRLGHAPGVPPSRRDPRLAVLALAVLAAGLVGQGLWGSVTGTGQYQQARRNELIWPDSLERTLRPYRDRMLARVPREGAVVAGFEFLSHLATRSDVHSLHHVVDGRYTYSDRPYPLPHDVRALVGDMYSMIPYLDFGSGRRMRTVAAERDLRPADAAGGTILMLPGATDSVEFYRFGVDWNYPSLDLLADGQLRFFGAIRLDSVVTPGSVVRISSYWQRVAPANRTYLAQIWLNRGTETALYSRARALCYGLVALPEWPLGAITRETFHLLIPDDMPPGSYTPLFRLIAVDSSGRQALPIVRVGSIAEPMNLVGLGPITVSAGKRKR